MAFEDENEVNSSSESLNEEDIPKLGMKKTFLFVMGGLVITIILIMFLRNIHIVDSGNSSESKEVVNTESKSDIKSVPERLEVDSKSSKNLGDSEGASWSSTENTTTQKNDISSIEVDNGNVNGENADLENNNYQKESSTKKDISNSNEFIEKVNAPDLSGSLEGTAMVSSKEVYRVDGKSFAYCVNLVLLKSGSDYADIRYFCPKKTYDGISEGDSITVEYSQDSSGVISIYSISR